MLLLVQIIKAHDLMHIAHFSQLQGVVVVHSKEISPQAMFNQFDFDGSGHISRAEAEDGIIKMIHPGVAARPAVAREVRKAFDKHAGIDDQVDLAQFIEIMKDSPSSNQSAPSSCCLPM
jgi:Ca2+-binding EF-hand superfamily protein